MTTRLTDAEIQAALDLCARATRPPWYACRKQIKAIYPRVRGHDGAGNPKVTTALDVLANFSQLPPQETTTAEDNVEFCAAARDLLPRALEEIRRTRAIEAERYEEAVRIARGGRDATE